MGNDPTDDDPGWPGIGRILIFFVPGALQFMHRRGDPLVTLRAVFLSFSMALVTFGVVLHIIGSPGPTRVLPFLWLVVVAAGLSIVAVAVATKPLDCTSEPKLATTYRSRFFLTIAFSQSVALFGFVFAFTGAPVWIYDLTALFALFRFWTVEPPTSQRLQQHQAALTASGCELSLIGALRRMSAPPRR